MRIRTTVLLYTLLLTPGSLAAQTSIRIMPPDGAVLAVGQRMDIRIEATSSTGTPPRGLVVRINGVDVTARNILDPGVGGERGAGGTGATSKALLPRYRSGEAPAHTTNFLLRDFTADTPGDVVIEARTEDGAQAVVRLPVEAWSGAGSGPRARNIILFLGDGMGAAHRTAARIVSRGVEHGRAKGRLAMDTLEVTGMVMTGALNSVITDSAPGMSAYTTGQKANNNQAGVFPDNTADAFDNPRQEYIGELLRRTRPGFHVGIVTTSSVTDATPTGNAVYTQDRDAGDGIAARFFDEREANGVSVLMGGGSRHFMPKDAGGARTDGRRLGEEFEAAGYTRVSTGAGVRGLLESAAPPARILGLFHPAHLPVAFDKVGAGRYSEELARPANEPYRDTPMLEDMTRLAIASLTAHSPGGFYLMVEGASIDKRAHAVDADRTIWDTIEFDRAVQVALDFARRTNEDDDPDNDTLVIVTADHECGGLGIIGVGNDRYAPATLGRAVRDYAAVFRFAPEQVLDFYPNYVVDERGYPVDPNPSRKLLIGWAAAPDRHENWVSNPLQIEAAVRQDGVAVANPARDGPEAPIPGFLVTGSIENGATGCPAKDGCPADTVASSLTISGHTATDVPLSASGPGAWQFTGVYENTDVFLKMLRAGAGTYPAR
jgi:alkaline phosphatase